MTETWAQVGSPSTPFTRSFFDVCTPPLWECWQFISVDSKDCIHPSLRSSSPLLIDFLLFPISIPSYFFSKGLTNGSLFKKYSRMYRRYLQQHPLCPGLSPLSALIAWSKTKKTTSFLFTKPRPLSYSPPGNSFVWDCSCCMLPVECKQIPFFITNNRGI